MYLKRQTCALRLLAVALSIFVEVSCTEGDEIAGQQLVIVGDGETLQKKVIEVDIRGDRMCSPAYPYLLEDDSTCYNKKCTNGYSFIESECIKKTTPTKHLSRNQGFKPASGSADFVCEKGKKTCQAIPGSRYCNCFSCPSNKNGEYILRKVEEKNSIGYHKITEDKSVFFGFTKTGYVSVNMTCVHSFPLESDFIKTNCAAFSVSGCANYAHCTVVNGQCIWKVKETSYRCIPQQGSKATCTPL